ncbi:sigma-70 family RNA polymerase sigma factor [Leptolyngbya sp. PL-A3]|uniref:sigma-70 family RNA polymerase sigma factor n=1 Tax=Leptolyngbya sp. PL-A3 TaxID=2933911 RepID=UPI003298A15A
MSSPDDRSDQLSLDERLRQLALMAQRYPAKSRERQRALTKLLSAMQRSNRLVRPQVGQFQGFYQDIYAEAMQRLFAYICDRIDDYTPARGEVLQWANFLLSRRFFVEASRDLMPTVYKGMDPKSTKYITIEDLDRNNPAEVNPQLTPSTAQEVEQVLQEDPEGLFQKTCIAGHPDASFQILAMKRMAGFSWQEISSELNIAIPTLSGFYQRCLVRFAPKLKEYLL